MCEGMPPVGLKQVDAPCDEIGRLALAASIGIRPLTCRRKPFTVNMLAVFCDSFKWQVA
jgi:hypothetical protein